MTSSTTSVLPDFVSLVRTIPERCRVCYTCVRECPAKAIRIRGGQAEVIDNRCIGCGNCVAVCSQHAKQDRSTIGEVDALLAADAPVAAIVAPSFPAELETTDHTRFVGAIRALGFDLVNEVAFGADLVADRYRQLLHRDDAQAWIATTCPALVAYVERYHPEIVRNLAPIVSPMIAMARVLRRLHGPELRIVFIGPCIGKKAEAANPSVAGEVDAVLTFRELRQMFHSRGITVNTAEPSSFDPPEPGLGQLFPIRRGLLQAADIKEDLLQAKVVSADGRNEFVIAVRDFAAGNLETRLLEVLCCNGCIMGPGMTTQEPRFRRRSRVSNYSRDRFGELNLNRWHAKMDRFTNIDLGRHYLARDRRIPAPSPEELEAILGRLGKQSLDDELNCGACGYDTCREHAVAIHKGLAEPEMCLPFTIERLNAACRDLASSHQELATTQQALMQSERLASMGQLAAGIAHEINNPLGVVLLYAHNLLSEATQTGLRDDLQMVVEQADRCKKIVSGLLNFARRNKVARQSVDLPKLVDHCLGMLAVPVGITVRTEHAVPLLRAEVDPDQIAQVLTNLVSNAVTAMPDGGSLGVRTSESGEDAVIEVFDTGTGIPAENIHKVFEPFFTTKQIGKGTGLGLAVTYGIVKMHRGTIQVRSNADRRAGPTGTTFTVRLPRRGEEEPPPPHDAEDEPPRGSQLVAG
ncbi:MAG: 4Fe-4S dicluster domain-containing protein [Polyangiaceae bacterium]|nr:4Fe-4S dicluster domain-containing protein [Polyangiaceae bacterium]